MEDTQPMLFRAWVRHTEGVWEGEYPSAPEPSQVRREIAAALVPGVLDDAAQVLLAARGARTYQVLFIPTGAVLCHGGAEGPTPERHFLLGRQHYGTLCGVCGYNFVPRSGEVCIYCPGHGLPATAPVSP